MNERNKLAATVCKLVRTHGYQEVLHGLIWAIDDSFFGTLAEREAISSAVQRLLDTLELMQKGRE